MIGNFFRAIWQFIKDFWWLVLILVLVVMIWFYQSLAVTNHWWPYNKTKVSIQGSTKATSKKLDKQVHTMADTLTDCQRDLRIKNDTISSLHDRIDALNKMVSMLKNNQPLTSSPGSSGKTSDSTANDSISVSIKKYIDQRLKKEKSHRRTQRRSVHPHYDYNRHANPVCDCLGN